MKLSALMTAALLAASLAAIAPTAGAQTLKKVADSNKITVSYREASIPFSYLIGSTKSVGFLVFLRTSSMMASVNSTENPTDLVEPIK